MYVLIKLEILKNFYTLLGKQQKTIIFQSISEGCVCLNFMEYENEYINTEKEIQKVINGEGTPTQQKAKNNLFKNFKEINADHTSFISDNNNVIDFFDVRAKKMMML
jgi:hypothetical protein